MSTCELNIFSQGAHGKIISGRESIYKKLVDYITAKIMHFVDVYLHS